MRLKKISERMQAALQSGKDGKKRSRKIGALLVKLGKKKQKFKSRLERAGSVSKKEVLKRKLATCETQIARGRKALSVAATEAASVAKTARIDDKSSVIKDPNQKAEPAAETEPQSGPVRH